MAAMAGLIVDMDAKTALNQFCQRYCSRPVTKVDIMYTTTKFAPNQFQAIVKLNCLEGQEYAGELCPNPKEAEKSAAQQALQAYAAAIAALPPVSTTVGSKKKKGSNSPLGPGAGRLGGMPGGMPQMPMGMGPGMGMQQPMMASMGGMPNTSLVQGVMEHVGAMDDGENPALTDKVRLNAACMKIAKRALQKGETLYETSQVGCGKAPNGFQSTVRLSCLPGDWANKMFAGQVSANKQGAEQSAATSALTAIMADPELSTAINQADETTKGSRAKNRGKGSGKNGDDKGGWTFVSGPDLPREPLSEAKMSGEVLEWKGSFGWVQAHQEIEHEQAKRRNGKVYVNKQDLVGVEELTQGATVFFDLFVDVSGLGAENVTVGHA